MLLYGFWLTELCCYMATDWLHLVIRLLTECPVLLYSHWLKCVVILVLNVCTVLLYRLLVNALCWYTASYRLHSVVIQLMADCIVLFLSYWLNALCCYKATDWLHCVDIQILTALCYTDSDWLHSVVIQLLTDCTLFLCSYWLTALCCYTATE